MDLFSKILIPSLEGNKLHKLQIADDKFVHFVKLKNFF